MNKKTLTLQAALLLFGLALIQVPVTNAQTYKDPYDVLLGDLQLPASARYAEAHAAAQQNRSAERREREQEKVFAEQRPAQNDFVIATEADARFASAPEETHSSATAISNISAETLGVLRLVERIEENREEAKLRQQAISLLAQNGMFHGGAPLLTAGKSGVPISGKGVVSGDAGIIQQPVIQQPGFVPNGIPGVWLPDGNFLPSGAYGLAPTGMGTIIFFIVMVGSVAYVLYRVKKGEDATRMLWKQHGAVL